MPEYPPGHPRPGQRPMRPDVIWVARTFGYTLMFLVCAAVLIGFLLAIVYGFALVVQHIHDTVQVDPSG